MAQTRSSLQSLVDAFVQKVNGQARVEEPVDDVPEFLREPPGSIDGWTPWRIVERDSARRIDELQGRTGLRFPPSFGYFLANYAFPAFEFGPLMFFANTGTDIFWELEQRLFLDEGMSPHLLKAGFLQIGNPYFYNYDPVCFDCSSQRNEYRIVQLDHEEILINGEMKILGEIAPSFIDFLHAALL